MTRPVTSVAAALAALALTAAGCNGDDDEKATTNPAPPVEAPSSATPPSDPGQLPPKFIKCMAKQGYEVKSSADIHSAPPQVLRECFGSLHQGGGAP